MLLFQKEKNLGAAVKTLGQLEKISQNVQPFLSLKSST